MKQEIKRFKNLEELSRGAAEFISDLAQENIESKGCFSMALSGGKTPVRLYEILSTPEFDNQMAWNKIHVFWGDERCVPPEDKNSNFKMGRDLLLSRMGLPDGNIHRILAELRPPEKAAEFYENDIKSFFSEYGNGSDISFDLIILGVGPDGHTASLFPASPVLRENERLVAVAQAPKGLAVKNRITFTLPLINKSSHVIFLVSGPEKRKIVASIFEDPKKSQLLYPSALVHPQGKLTWFVDEGVK